jgi:hypothetical protein
MQRRTFIKLIGIAVIAPNLPKAAPPVAGKMQAGHFLCDGGPIYLPLGFVPDMLKLYITGKDEPVVYEWFSVEGCPPCGEKTFAGIKIPGAVLPKGRKAKFFALKN